MQTKVNKPHELNTSSTTTKTDIEQKKRKPQGRVEDRYYTIQEYKALSNEQEKELKDLRANRGHNPQRRKFNKGSVKGQLAAREQQLSVLQFNQGTNGGVAQNTSPSGTPLATNGPTTSENSNNHSHPALTHEQGRQAEGDRDTQEPSGGRVTFSNQNSTRNTSEVRTSRVGSLTFNNESNCELDSHADTCVLGNMHTSSWMMGKQLTLLDMVRPRGHLQAT